MAYSGYLVKVGNYTIPFKYMSLDTFIATRNTQDLDSYHDANGYLQRNALSVICDKVEFKTPYLHNADKTALLSKIQSNYTSSIERRASVTVYVPEYDIYTTQNMYFPNPEITIYQANESDILYEPIRICFISYGVVE